MKQYTDQHYIQKTLEGDIRAFSVLIERYEDFVYTIVVRILKVREEAEEIAQDAFLKAYESLQDTGGNRSFPPGCTALLIERPWIGFGRITA